MNVFDKKIRYKRDLVKGFKLYKVNIKVVATMLEQVIQMKLDPYYYN